MERCERERKEQRIGKKIGIRETTEERWTNKGRQEGGEGRKGKTKKEEGERGRRRKVEGVCM